MKRVVIHRHPQCAKCARIARVHRALDWFDRIETSVDAPPTGPLRKGGIVAKDLATNSMARGADAFALICRANPLYTPLRALPWFAPLRRLIDLALRGDEGANTFRPLTDGKSAA